MKLTINDKFKDILTHISIINKQEIAVILEASFIFTHRFTTLPKKKQQVIYQWLDDNDKKIINEKKNETK